MKNDFKSLSFVLLIPILNILADIFTNYFDAEKLNPGNIRAGIIIIFLLFFFASKYKAEQVGNFILFYVIFLIVLVFFSSSKLFSLMILIKASLAFLMYPVGYYYFNTFEKFGKLNITYLIVIGIVIINLLITNYFQIGTSDYSKDSFYFGSARVNITKTLSALLLCTPLMILFIKKKSGFQITTFIFLSALVLVFIGVKRTAMISILGGFLIYLLLTARKTKMIKYLTIGVILLFIASPLYLDLIEERLDAREKRLTLSSETLDSEARYNEVFIVTNAWINGDIIHKLFGSELFNDRDFFRTQRMLHTDYMTILNGSGIIGLLLFFGVYIIIIIEKNKYYRHLTDIPLMREYNAVFWALLFSMNVLSIAGTVHSTGSRAFMFMYLGAIIRLMREEYKIKYLPGINTKSFLFEDKTKKHL